MPNIAVRISDEMTAMVDRQATRRSTATRAVLLLGLAAAGEDMLPLLPEIVAARRERKLSPGLQQAIETLYQQVPRAGGGAAASHPAAPPDVDAGGYTF
jgi:hypothetical protein